MPVDSAIWVTGASSIGLGKSPVRTGAGHLLPVLTPCSSAVGGTIVCTLLGAVLFARGVAQVPCLSCSESFEMSCTSHLYG